MTHISTIAQHLLAAFLIIGVPVLDVVQTRRLKASRNPRAKVEAYRQILVSLWVAAIIAVLAAGFASVTTINDARQNTPWLPWSDGMRSFLSGFLVAAIVALLLPAVLARRNPKFRERLDKFFARLRFFLPHTQEERAWFAVLSITAGVCEEILYRGFLIQYLRAAPFHGTLTAALILSSVAFSLGHLYQGAPGVAQTFVLGLVLGLLFLVTGNILMPVILHALIDLRVLALLPTSREPAAPVVAPESD